MLDEIPSFVHPETFYSQIERIPNELAAKETFTVNTVKKNTDKNSGTVENPQTEPYQVPITQSTPSSIWNKLTNFFKPSSTDAATETDGLQKNTTEAISRIPQLDMPSETVTSHVRNVLQGKETLSLADSKDESKENISFEDFLMSLLKTQLEIGEQGGAAGIGLGKVNQRQKKALRDRLQEIKDKQKENQKWEKYFGSIQAVTSNLSTFSTGATALGSGLTALGVAPNFIPAASVIIGTNAAFLAGMGLVSDGAATAGKAYFDQKGNEFKNEETRFEHEKNRLDNASAQQIEDLAQSHELILDSMKKMNELKLQKSRTAGTLLSRPIK